MNAKRDEEIKILRSKNEAQLFVDEVYLSILTFNPSEIVSNASKIKFDQYTGLVKILRQQKAAKTEHIVLGSQIFSNKVKKSPFSKRTNLPV